MLNSWVLRLLLLPTGKPYINLGENRLFPRWIKWSALKWHMDDEDRTVEATHKTDWMLQLENKLPVSLDKPIFIEKHQWHRLIKGKGHLTVKIIKIGSKAENFSAAEVFDNQFNKLASSEEDLKKAEEEIEKARYSNYLVDKEKFLIKMKKSLIIPFKFEIQGSQSMII